MKITNKQLSVLVEGLTQLAVDSQNQQRRNLPFVSGVRLRRTLEHFDTLFEPVRESFTEAQNSLSQVKADLIDKVKDDSIDYGKDEFEEDFGLSVEDANEELERLLEDEVVIDTDNLVTLTQLEEIGEKISDGVPQSAIDAYLLLEELLKENTPDEHIDDTEADNGS